MLLRNSRVPVLLLFLLFTTLAGRHQAVASPVPRNAEQQTSQTSTTSPQSQDQKSQTQPSPSQQSQPPQSQAQPPQDQGSSSDSGVFVFKKEVEEVVVHATVMDDKNHLVTTLDQSAFSIFENNQPQTIASFRHEDVPVAMGIVIDNSGSMREKRDKVNRAALNLVRSSNPQDQVFVVNFNDEYYLDQEFTSNINKLREALEKVEARGGTALYDAIVASSVYMRDHAKQQKKVLFVVTDGEEKARRARRALETIAQRTGGISFFPRTLDEVDSISSSVAHDIRNQYTIGYKPTTPKTAGGYRAIRVEAKAKGYGKLVVRTRSGYYPGQEHAPQ